jgi:hypothetical protein
MLLECSILTVFMDASIAFFLLTSWTLCRITKGAMGHVQYETDESGDAEPFL